MFWGFVMLGLDARRVSTGLFVLVAGFLSAVPARAFAPTPAGAPAWADGGVCRRLRSSAGEMVDLAFTAPRIATLRAVHLRIDPGAAPGSDRYVLRLETDAGGMPSGQALATTEVAKNHAVKDLSADRLDLRKTDSRSSVRSVKAKPTAGSLGDGHPES